jgi:hypothetical protein
MGILTFALTVLGLSLFETVSSVDNAIINAEVLTGMGARARRWFLTWGILIAVFLVRGLLPWLIVWLALPSLGPIGALTAAFSSDPVVIESVEKTAPVLLMGGGVFLVLLFLHWLFLEPKQYGLVGEKFFASQGVWFFAVAAVFLSLTVWFSLRAGSMVAFAAVIGSTVFFITHGFKENAEAQEQRLMSGNLSDMSKILYLEIIDTTFSIDGVLGAFAFTLSVPIIILGSGLGAVIVRQITVGNIGRIKRYRFHAASSIFVLFPVKVSISARPARRNAPSCLPNTWTNNSSLPSRTGNSSFQSPRPCESSSVTTRNFSRPSPLSSSACSGSSIAWPRDPPC